MPSQLKAIVECLDSGARAGLARIELPAYDGTLTWDLSPTDATTRPRKSNVIFVLATEAPASAVAERVALHRDAGHTAIGASVARPDDGEIAPMDNVARLSPGAWQDDIRMLLASVTATFCEGQPDVVVCIDWGDVSDLLDLPGELIIEWSLQANAIAFRSVFARVKARLRGRKCRGMLCLLSGGRHRWFKELRLALRMCRAVLAEGGMLLGGDSLAPFGGNPGCCLLAVVDEGLPETPVHAT